MCVQAFLKVNCSNELLRKNREATGGMACGIQ